MRTTTRSLLALGLSMLSFACGSGDETSSKMPPTPEIPAVEAAGPHAVGNATVTLQDTARDRSLRVEIWYPAAPSAKEAAAAGTPIEDFAPAGAERDEIAALVAKAPDPGTSRTAHSARDAAPVGDGPWPTVAFSHCYNCTRYSTFAIAERLASHGIAVIAPDHTGGTLPDALAGNAAPLDATFLQTRAADVRFVLDRALDPQAADLPADLRGRFDATRVGVFGHSFGGVTAGLVLMNDPRPRAGLAIAVPMENPLLPGVTMTSLHVPLFFFLATEDNSIGTIGNQFLRQNYEDANPPVSLLEVEDAGHWSFTNICGIVPNFEAGCAANPTRQTDGTPFQYLDIDVARGIAQAYVTAFFLAQLEGDAAAKSYLTAAHPADVTKLSTRAPQ